MMLKRGPQAMQLTRAWRCRRLPGSSMSARQSGQTGRSGDGKARPGRGSLSRIWKRPAPRRNGFAGSRDARTPAPAGKPDGRRWKQLDGRKRKHPRPGPPVCGACPFREIASRVWRMTWAGTGRPVRNAFRKPSSRAGPARAMISTRPPRLRTAPRSRQARAIRAVYGRRPTPWTTPQSRIRSAVRPAASVRGTMPPRPQSRCPDGR